VRQSAVANVSMFGRTGRAAAAAQFDRKAVEMTEYELPRSGSAVAPALGAVEAAAEKGD